MMASKNSDFVLEDGMDEDEEMLSFQTQMQSMNDNNVKDFTQRQQEEEDSQNNINTQSKITDTSLTSTTTETKPTTATTITSDSTTTTTTTPASETIEQTTATTTTTTTTTPKQTIPNEKEQQKQEPEQGQVKAVIVDGLPLSARRSDLDSILKGCAKDVTHVRLRRLERHKLLRVYVEFRTSSATNEALSLDGTLYGSECYLSIKPASEERWVATQPISTQAPHKQQTQKSKNEFQEQVSKSFWNAFSAAKSVAEQLEERARQLGEKLENELHVSERLKESKIPEKLEQVAQAGRDTARAVDEKLGISNGAKLMAREVDENLRVSEKARDAANMAMTSSSPTVNRMARSVVNSLDRSGGGAINSQQGQEETGTPSKKGYEPRKLEFGEADMDDAGRLPTDSNMSSLSSPPSTSSKSKPQG